MDRDGLPGSQLGRVFVSSVFGGMLDWRRHAAEAAELLGLTPVLTEQHVAQPRAVRGSLAREIAACDVYLGLFDRRRGTVPAAGTRDGRAITEEEFHLARELGLRCLVFLSKSPDDEREPALAEFLERDVTDYATGLWTRPYGSAAELRREVVAALAALRPRVVLSLGAGAGGLEARLHLEDLRPAWRGEGQLGPVTVDLDLDRMTAGVVEAFLAGEQRRRLPEASLVAAGARLAEQALPGALGEAFAAVLEQAAHHGRLVVLEVRSRDADALALPWELLSFAGRPLQVKNGLLEVVRRLPAPGEELEPGRDLAASVPAAALSILGFTASPLEDQEVQARLGAAGLGDADLFWENEQERLLVALEPLLRDGRGRLRMLESGSREVLRQALLEPDRPQVVHFSCHGGPVAVEGATAAEASEQALFLEDDEGRRAPLRGDELLAWLHTAPGARPVELLVLSACYTAASTGGGAGQRAPASELAVEGRQGGLAERLVRGGAARVLGMQTSVSDRGATAFAEAFYGAVARGTDLPAALRRGRVELAASGEPHEWAIPVLYAGREVGPLVAPVGVAAPVATPFEQARHDFEIGGVSYLEQGYVGRRGFERDLWRAWQADEGLLVIHGFGGIGKSTLAARFLERRRAEGARVWPLFAGRELAPPALFEEVARRAGVERRAAGAPEQVEAQLRADLRAALRAGEPAVLLLDNFEDNQLEDGALRNPALGEALAELLELGGEGLRVVVTSRLPVELSYGGCAARNFDLGELSPSGCRKLRMIHREGLGRLEEAAWQRVLHHLGGHPKALELLDGFLKARRGRVEGLLERFEAAEAHVERALARERQTRGRKLLIETVLGEVPEERRPAFDRLCLLAAPLPSVELVALLVAEGIEDPAGELEWLRRRGLLASKVAPSAIAGDDAVHRLLAVRRGDALREREGAEAEGAWHLRVAEHLVERPGPLTDLGLAARHRDAAGDRAGALKLYGRWAMNLRDRHAYAACAQIAQEGLMVFPPGEDTGARLAATSLYRTIHDGLLPLGHRQAAWVALEAAAGLVPPDADDAPSLFARAVTHWKKGQFLVSAGDISSGHSELEKAAADYKAGSFERERAITLADIARLRAQAGDTQEALKLHQELIRIFEHLGDVHSRAGTLGDIARLRAQAGDTQEALKLLQEQVRIFEQLGDVRSRAVALGDIAFLRAQAGDTQEALKLLQEKLRIFEQLGDVLSRAVTLGDIALLRAKAGDTQEALKLHQEELRTYEQLGDVRSRAITLGYIARLRAQAGDTQEALKLHQEVLRTYEQLGDVRSRAVTLVDIARLRAQAGDTHEAFKLHSEALQLARELGDVEAVAGTQLQLGQLDLEAGRGVDARNRLTEAWQIVNQIQRLDGIAFVGWSLGRSLAGVGETTQALQVLEISRAAFERLGMPDRAAQAQALLAQLEDQDPDPPGQ